VDGLLAEAGELPARAWQAFPSATRLTARLGASLKGPGREWPRSAQRYLHRLLHTIAELPPRCREILVLRKFENLSHREIAKKLGISEHTVESQLTKGLHRCVEFFARHGLP
jgi:DNA-directed RNA polymerase specialized sigma24 family protein